MRFIAILTCTENRRGEESKELKRLEFDAPSITAAKARATKEANKLVFLEEVQSWDNEIKTTVGKDIRWQSWSVPPSTYTQEDGRKVAFSGKSATFFGIYTYKIGASIKSGTSITYYAGVTLHWEIKNVVKEKKESERRMEQHKC